jgi:hypothetical protein
MRKSCECCKSPIEGKRADAKFCSKQCLDRTKAARWRAANLERSRAIWTRYALSPRGTVTLMLNYARDRALEQDVPFDLDHEFLLPKLEAGVCELTGLPFERIRPGGRKTHPFGPSLDRKNRDLGYVKSNTRLVCCALNTAFADWGEEVWLILARALVARHGP